jgi:hypothetical protein
MMRHVLKMDFLAPLSVEKIQFRLNGGFKDGFRRETFAFSAPSPFLFLPTESKLSLRPKLEDG